MASEREVEALAPAPCELVFFFLFSFPLQRKVQSKQSEVNGFIFSCARQFVHNRELLLFVLFTINANIY